MRTEQLESIAPGSDPLRDDKYHLYTRIGSNLDVYLMFEACSDQIANYIIVVDRCSGERVRVTFDHALLNAGIKR